MGLSSMEGSHDLCVDIAPGDEPANLPGDAQVVEGLVEPTSINAYAFAYQEGQLSWGSSLYRRAKGLQAPVEERCRNDQVVSLAA